MSTKNDGAFSRRERQIMNILYRRGEASAAEVQEALPDPPSYSAVRALMRILEEKGHLKHRSEGNKYVYAPVRPRRNAAREALRNVLQTFYEGSTAHAMAALLDLKDTDLSDEELDRLSVLIEKARKEGR